jgi:hypothetical protein
MKYLKIIFLMAIFSNVYSQTDTINGAVVRRNSIKVEVFCPLEKIKSKTYHTKIGHSYRKVAPANGWFKMDGICPREIYDLPIVECKFNLTQHDLYIKYKRGRRFSGRINEKDNNYRIIGFCRKGLLHGKIKILDNQKKSIWEGKMSHGLQKNN